MDKHDLLEDYTDRPVPQKATVGGLDIALIITGVGIALPGFLQGATIGTALGFYGSLKVFFLGSLIHAILGVLCAYVAVNARVSTYMMIKRVFGVKGALLINALFTFSLFGWFGVNASLFGESVYSSINQSFSLSINQYLLTIIGGALMVATAIFGFKALDKLANLSVPLLLASLGYLIYLSIGTAGWPVISAATAPQMEFGVAVSSVVGSMIVAVVILPDLCRYARSYRSAICGVLAAFLLGQPFVLLASSVPALATESHNIIGILLGLKLGLIALFVVVFATWTSNAGNLYSATLSLSALLPKFKSWRLCLFAGICGTLVAVAGIIEHFIPFLLVLGIGMPPVAGIYLVHFFVFQRAREVPETLPEFCCGAFSAWVLGVVVGVLSVNQWFSITGIAACDAILGASLAYGLIKFAGKRITVFSLYLSEKRGI